MYVIPILGNKYEYFSDAPPMFPSCLHNLDLVLSDVDLIPAIFTSQPRSLNH